MLCTQFSHRSRVENHAFALDTYIVLNDFYVFLGFASATIINEIMLRASAYKFKSLDYGLTTISFQINLLLLIWEVIMCKIWTQVRIKYNPFYPCWDKSMAKICEIQRQQQRMWFELNLVEGMSKLNGAMTTTIISMNQIIRIEWKKAKTPIFSRPMHIASNQMLIHILFVMMVLTWFVVLRIKLPFSRLYKQKWLKRTD